MITAARNAFRSNARRARSRRELRVAQDLGDHLLRDIGLTRDEIRHALRQI